MKQKIHEAYHWFYEIEFYDDDEGKRAIFRLGATPRSSDEIGILSGECNDEQFYQFCEASQSNVAVFATETELDVTKRRISELHVPDLFEMKPFTVFEDVVFFDSKESPDRIREEIDGMRELFNISLEPLKPQAEQIH